MVNSANIARLDGPNTSTAVKDKEEEHNAAGRRTI